MTPFGDTPMGIWRMKVSNKSVFPTSCDRDRLQGNLFSFENKNDLEIMY